MRFALVAALLFAGAVHGAPAPRIVTLAPHLAELAFDAGAGARVVATVAYSDQPAAAARLPVVGDAFRIDLERLVAARPDVVLAWGEGTPAAVKGSIEALDIRVVTLSTPDLRAIAANLRAVGALAGTQDAAEAAADAYLKRLDALRARYGGRVPVRVFYQISDRPLYTVGEGHILTDMIAVCGGVNVFGELDAVAPSVTVEAVIAADPQVIVGGVYPPPADGELGGLAHWLRWPRVSAVADGRLVPLDASLFGRPTVRLLDGVEQLCEAIDRVR